LRKGFGVELSCGITAGGLTYEKKEQTHGKSQKHKHLTLEERSEIQECLSHGMSFKAIGKRIGKDQTTVSKEVKRHIVTIAAKTEHYDPKTHERIYPTCEKLLKPPFVCNPCKLCNHACRFDRRKYIAVKAHEDYERELTNAREGINFNDEAFYEMDRIITGGVKSGQHIYQIIQSNDFSYKKSAIYNHIKKGNLSVCATDLPRMVKFKQRKAKYAEYIPAGLKISRSYADFCALKEETGLAGYVEMDTVIGRIGGKCVLTFLFHPFNFMLGLLLDNKTSAEVSQKLIKLKGRLAECGFCFKDVFPVILTDNGGEFADVFTIENNLSGIKESSLYFCDPYHSWEKPHIEKNHTLFRDIAPSGTSFDDWSQHYVDAIFSHVNATARASFGGKTAYAMFSFVFGESTALCLGITHVEPKDVVQTPMLLKALKALQSI
jgi:IS30 family transposase